MARLATFCTVALVLLATAVASAQTSDARARRRRALGMLDESSVLYREGRFQEAADLLRVAHGLYPEPALLYNLGRALDAAGDLRAAVDAYTRYLGEDPESARRGEVEQRIAALGSQLEAQSDASTGATEPPPTDTNPRGGGDVVSQPAPPPERPSLLGPVIVAAAGGAMVATGAVAGTLALGKQDDARTATSQRELAVLDDEAHDLATAANVLFVVGGAVAAAGLVWILLATGGGDDGETQNAAVVELGPGMVVVRGHL